MLFIIWPIVSQELFSFEPDLNCIFRMVYLFTIGIKCTNLTSILYGMIAGECLYHAFLVLKFRGDSKAMSKNA